MPITDILERNRKLYGSDIALVEINPEVHERRRRTWRDYELIEANPTTARSPGAYLTRRPTALPTCS